MASTPPSATAQSRTDQREIYIFSHSTLIYYWPVWLFGFIFGAWTYIEGSHVAWPPKNATVEVQENAANANLSDVNIKFTAAKGKDGLESFGARTATQGDKVYFPTTISRQRLLGLTYTAILFLCIFFTNVPLRGLWSVIAIAAVVLIVLILMLTGVLDEVFGFIGTINPFMNSAFYFTLAVPVFIAWILTATIFDRQTYLIFTPGQIRYCLEIGGGERSHDSRGSVVAKQRDDLFRHWILGLGSGDLVVKTSGADAQEMVFPNVLFIGTKLAAIQEMQRDRPTVQG